MIFQKRGPFLRWFMRARFLSFFIKEAFPTFNEVLLLLMLTLTKEKRSNK